MILPLRQRHRQMVLTLGLILPVAFAAGILLRAPAPQMASLPPQLVAPQPKFGATLWERADLFVQQPIQVKVCREETGASRFAVQLAGPKDFLKPDLLVYWVAGESATTNNLSSDAQFIGVFNPAMTLPMPIEASSAKGQLILYSLADSEVVAVSQPFTFQKP